MTLISLMSTCGLCERRVARLKGQGVCDRLIYLVAREAVRRAIKQLFLEGV